MSIERPYFQVGVIVGDLQAGMHELTASIGIGWNAVRSRPGGGRLVFSAGGPPYIELIEGTPGTYWDPAGGPRLDHLGFWCADYEFERRRLIDAGLPVVADGAPAGRPWSYHATRHAGMRLELLSTAMRTEFEARWGTDQT